VTVWQAGDAAGRPRLSACGGEATPGVLVAQGLVGLKLTAWGVPETRGVRNYRVKCAVILAVLAGAGGAATAQDMVQHSGQGSSHGASPGSSAQIAIPRELSPPQEAYAAFPEAVSATPSAAPAAPSACQLQLSKLATFQPLPVLVGPGECGATDAVLLDAVILPDQNKVIVSPAATLRCPIAVQIAQWVRDDVAPTVLKFGAPLRGLDNFDSYECRGRNRVRGAILSEHGRADALDVRLFKLADGKTLTLTDVNVDKNWREALKASACARFSTILGPGSDGAHEEHIHLDLAERRNNYKVCEWDVRVPPPPTPPAVAQTQPKDAAPPAAGAAPDDAIDNEASIPPDAVPLPRSRPLAANTARRQQ
jgi:hypothetical protein